MYIFTELCAGAFLTMQASQRHSPTAFCMPQRYIGFLCDIYHLLFCFTTFKYTLSIICSIIPTLLGSILYKSEKKRRLGIATVAQQDRQSLGRAGMQVQSPAPHSLLRIWSCCSSCSLGQLWIPGLRTPYSGWPKKKEKKKAG